LAVEYRPLIAPVDLERMVDLEILVWGLDPRDAVPSTMLGAISHSGGMINGAFVNHQLVGFGVMFPAIIPAANLEDAFVYWSHITGVHPDHQKSGIGFQLKRAQRDWAVEHRASEIRWTFDPLQRGNANFNLRRLGVTFDRYLINFYGFMTDEINKGMPSDRVEAVWRLNDPRVIALANKQIEMFAESYDYPALLSRDSNGIPCINGHADGHTLSYLAYIPHSLKTLDRETILAWRLALRETLQQAFEAGYYAYDFDPEKCAYVLHKRVLGD